MQINSEVNKAAGWEWERIYYCCLLQLDSRRLECFYFRVQWLHCGTGRKRRSWSSLWYESVSYLQDWFRDRWAPPGGARRVHTGAVRGRTAAGGEPRRGTGGEAPLQPLHLASGHKQQAVVEVFISFQLISFTNDPNWKKVKTQEWREQKNVHVY